MRKFSSLAQLSSLFLLWRAMLFLIGALAAIFFVYQPTFTPGEWAAKNLPQWLYSWANFDGAHYLTIINEGYLKTDLIQAFFPGFPLSARVITGSGLSPLLAGLILSNLAMFLLIIFWFRFLRLTFSKEQAFIGTLILLTFPTSFFLGAFYNESMFMLLTIGAFLAAAQKRWIITGVLIALATATRVVGIVLVPALLIEIYLQANGANTLSDVWRFVKQKQIVISLKTTYKNYWPAIILVLSGSVGLITYMLYLRQNFNDPLYFFHVQNEFGGFRSEKLIMYPQVVWRSLKILATNALSWRYLTYFQEALAGIVGMGALLYALKSVRLSWVIYSIGIMIIPAFTGTFSSMPRYILPAFALMILLTQVLAPRTRLLYVYLIISAILLAINTMLFVQGYWVA